MTLTAIELCAGAGGQALGLERAGFAHAALVELDPWACATLRMNRPDWNVIEGDLRAFDPSPYCGVDLVAGGVPCPPFSKAGRQLGADDERDLFPEALRVVEAVRPLAVMLENVRGLLDPVFLPYRKQLQKRLSALGYWSAWNLLNAADFGVPQLRPRVNLVALRPDVADFFCWPAPQQSLAPTVGDTLFDLMARGGWAGAATWRTRANNIGPTLVGGSKKHGGPDLGPSRARAAWAALGVDGAGLADVPPEVDFDGLPRLTVRMAARIQGFPDEWQLAGRKTAAYRQVGNAFPPPVAHAVGMQIAKAIRMAKNNLALRRAA